MADATEAVSGLIERIEAAGGPDREIDCLIWGTLDGRSLEWQGSLLVEKTEGPIGWIDPGEHQRNFGCNRADQGSNGIRAYTASIDAAMTLLPDNCGFVMWYPVGKRPSVALQFGYEDHPAPKTVDGWGDYSSGATPALALCAAALKAKAMEARQGRDRNGLGPKDGGSVGNADAPERNPA